MSVKKAKSNPFCSVPGCQTKRAHTDEKPVKVLLAGSSFPLNILALTVDAMRELGNAACNELAHGQVLAFISRLRPIEELYLRTLYLLLLADQSEYGHILSGAVPNGLSRYYRLVNPAIFGGRGDWEAKQAGLDSDVFSIFDTLNDGAHVSYYALLMARGLASDPSMLITVERYAKHIDSHLAKLRYMQGMFTAGRDRADVLDGIRCLHQPPENWEQKAQEARGAEPPSGS